MPLSRARRAQLIKALRRLIDQKAVRWRPAVASAVRDLVEKLAARLESQGLDGPLALSAADLGPMRATFGRMIRDSLDAGASFQRGALSVAGDAARRVSTDFQALANEYVADRTADKVVAVSEQIRSQVRNIVAAGVELETPLTIPEIAASIRAAANGIGEGRSLVIARTETHSALNFATQKQAEIVAKALDVKVKKEWISAEDTRTRPTHLLADGQVRDLDKPFSVGGAALMFPGDPAGPPGEVINCRCTQLIYEA